VALTLLVLVVAYRVGFPALWGTSLMARIASILAAATALFATLGPPPCFHARSSESFGAHWRDFAFGPAALVFPIALGWMCGLTGVESRPIWGYLAQIGILLALFALSMAASHTQTLGLHREAVAALAARSVALNQARRELDVARRHWSLQTRADVRSTVERALHQALCLPVTKVADALRSMVMEMVRPSATT
jgi:hypothetical protein